MIERSSISTDLIFVGLGILVLFTIVNAFALRTIRSLTLKRRVFLGYLAAIALAFCVVVVFASGQPLALLAAVPVAMFYVVTQFLATRFCVSCGRTVFSGPWSSRPAHCPACGGECQFAWRSHT